MEWSETNLSASRLLGLEKFRLAFETQIGFNAWARLKRGTRNEKAIRGFGSGLSDTGVHGGAGIGPNGKSRKAESSGKSKLRARRWQDDYGGLLESAGERAEDLRWFGALRRGMAHRRK